MLFEKYYLYRAEDHGYHECRIPLLTTDKGTVLAFNEDYSHVIYSDDHEACWQIGGSADRGANESTAVETADGWLYLNSSNQSRAPQAAPASTGRSPGAVTAASASRRGWRMPHCRSRSVRPACAATVWPATAAAVTGSCWRHHLTVRLSYDECRSWPIARVLCAEPASYSDLSVVPDGTTCCLYENGQEKGVSYYSGDIAFARFDLEWLTGGQDRL